MDSQTRKGPAAQGGIDRARLQNQRSHSTPIDAVISRLERVKPTGPGTWLASCPTSRHARGDRSRGLSIREGDDGRVLIHCHAGCPVDEIVGALGLQLQDLFPAREITYPSHSPRHGLIGRPRVIRIPWPDLFEALEHQLLVCSMAFSDLAKGKDFTAEDAEAISRLAGQLATEIREVRHGRV
jgi:hypothetical protein